MMEELLKLRDCLINNNYNQEADTISEMIDEINENGKLSNNSRELLISMCHPRYLGDLLVKEYNNQYDWWRFLSEIRRKIKGNIET